MASGKTLDSCEFNGNLVPTCVDLEQVQLHQAHSFVAMLAWQSAGGDNTPNFLAISNVTDLKAG